MNRRVCGAMLIKQVESQRYCSVRSGNAKQTVHLGKNHVLSFCNVILCYSSFEACDQIMISAIALNSLDYTIGNAQYCFCVHIL